MRVKGERPSEEVSKEVSCEEVPRREVCCQEFSGQVWGEGMRGPASAPEHRSVGGGAGGGHALEGKEEQGECVCAGGVTIGGYPSVVAFTGKLFPYFRFFFYCALFPPLLPPFLNLC